MVFASVYGPVQRREADYVTGSRFVRGGASPRHARRDDGREVALAGGDHVEALADRAKPLVGGVGAELVGDA